ncbi:MAG: hypothetical protein H0X30_32380 [Anaerolineae bacterium]|nr:hypothetical protein [Anaerolineae bacterium]
MGCFSAAVCSANWISRWRRLENEGVTFSVSGKININSYGWDGPNTDWLRENNFLMPKPIKKPTDDKSGQMKLF